VRLVSRNRNEFNYPQLLDGLKLLSADLVVLDGEIVALDEKGRSSFQLLQLFKRSGDVPLVYYVFDLLFLEGKDLRKEPLGARCKLLGNLLKKPPENIRLSDERRAGCSAVHHREDGLNARKRSSTSDSSFPHSWRSSSLK
jgi:bifunctional non-homologous end joining protein LigD